MFTINHLKTYFRLIIFNTIILNLLFFSIQIRIDIIVSMQSVNVIYKVVKE